MDRRQFFRRGLGAVLAVSAPLVLPQSAIGGIFDDVDLTEPKKPVLITPNKRSDEFDVYSCDRVLERDDVGVSYDGGKFYFYDSKNKVVHTHDKLPFVSFGNAKAHYNVAAAVHDSGRAMYLEFGPKTKHGGFRIKNLKPDGLENVQIAFNTGDGAGKLWIDQLRDEGYHYPVISIDGFGTVSSGNVRIYVNGTDIRFEDDPITLDFNGKTYSGATPFYVRGMKDFAEAEFMAFVSPRGQVSAARNFKYRK